MNMNIDDFSLKIRVKFVALGLQSKYSHAISGNTVDSFFFEPLATIPLSKFLGASNDIAIAIGTKEDVLIRRDGKYICVQIPHPSEERKVIPLTSCLEELLREENKEKWRLPLMLGQSPDNITRIYDLANAPHLLICGQTGSGKSILESAIIIGLAMYSKNLELITVDIKGVDFEGLKKLPQIHKTVKTAREFHELITFIREEISRRYSRFTKERVRNIHEYTASGESMDYIVVVIDELAALIDANKDMNRGVPKNEREFPSVEEQLKSICQISRAAGVHIIAATQRASVDILSGTIKANFPYRICLKVPSSQDSRVVLDENGAEKLLGRGDMLIKSTNDASIERIHGPYVPPGNIEAFVELLTYK